MRPINLIYKSLTTRIAPMVYVLMFINLLIGLFFTSGYDMQAESILYSTGVLFNRAIWGVLLLITSSIGMYGLIAAKEWAIQLSGISGFMLWLFACIALAMAAHWYVLATIAVMHLLFHGYVYLATATGVIYRSTVGR